MSVTSDVIERELIYKRIKRNVAQKSLWTLEGSIVQPIDKDNLHVKSNVVFRVICAAQNHI